MSGKFASVLIAIGAETSGLRTGLQSAEKWLTRFHNKAIAVSRRATLIGAELTRGITLPIGLVSFAAVKAYRDIDLLRRGLILVAGDAKKGAQEFKNLAEVARLPGIGFEEAIKGSIQLQSIGIAADSARAVLIGLGKANLYSAGTTETFGGAMQQLTDILVRGKVTMEDWRRVTKNVPVFGDLVKDAFGTGDVEKIRESGIGAGTFIAEIMKKALEMADANKILGDSTDSLANSWDNFVMDLKLGGAAIGETIVKSGNLQSLLGQIAGGVRGLGDAFAKMNPEQQKSFIQMVAMVAVLPLGIRLLGQLGLVGATVVLPFFKGLIWGVRQALKPVGAIIVMLGVLDQILLSFRKHDDGKDGIGDVLRRAVLGPLSGIESVARGMNELGILTDENGRATSAMSKGWDALKGSLKAAGGEIYDMVFGEGSLSGLNDAINMVKDGMKNANMELPNFDMEKLEAALDKLKGMFVDPGGDDKDKVKKLRDLNKEYEQLLKTMSALGKGDLESFGEMMSFSAGAVEELVKRGLERGNPELEKWIARYRALLDIDMAAKWANEAEQIDRLAEALKKMPEAKPVVSSPTLKDPFAGSGMGNALHGLFQGILDNPRLKDALKITAGEWMNDIVKFADKAALVLGSLGEILSAAFEAREQKIENYYDKEIQKIQDSAMAEEDKQARIKRLEESRDKEMRKLRRKQAVLAKAAALAEAGVNIAVAITAALKLGAAGIPLAAVIGGLGAVQLGIIAGTPLPSAKHGGAAFGETLVNVGDYPSASVDPEVIAPASMIGDILAEQLGGGGDRIVGVLSGDDILLVASRAQYNQKRRRGLTLQF